MMHNLKEVIIIFNQIQERMLNILNLVLPLIQIAVKFFQTNQDLLSHTIKGPFCDQSFVVWNSNETAAKVPKAMTFYT